ncbi:MAG: hypothetical protein HC895_20340 [Leptolyngbyaceae cyanobacterium SM1_3_5]|nr:hypothetical protein [Leptolyngbyaceae cyanobacterium SM1_3_5]
MEEIMHLRSLRQNIQELKQLNLESAQASYHLANLVKQFTAHNSFEHLLRSRSSNGLYRRHRLTELTDDFHIILATWEPHSCSPIHDHDETIGAVAVVAGQTVETKYRCVAHAERGLCVGSSGNESFANCTVSPILPGDNLQIHQMANQTDALAATLHVYLHALDRFHLYEHHADRQYALIPKQLWFDQDSVDRPIAEPALIGVS